MKLLLLPFALLLLSTLQASSHDSTKHYSHYLNVSFFSHSVSLPFTASNQIISSNRLPGIRFEAGKYFGEGSKRLRTGYAVAAAAYHQKELHYGYELGNLLHAAYSLHKRFSLKGALGLAYLHTFEDAALYKVDESSYSQTRDWGRSQFNALVSLGCQTQISTRCAVTAHYSQILQMPFARKSGVFFIPHSRASLGLSYNFSY